MAQCGQTWRALGAGWTTVSNSELFITLSSNFDSITSLSEQSIEAVASCVDVGKAFEALEHRWRLRSVLKPCITVIKAPPTARYHRLKVDEEDSVVLCTTSDGGLHVIPCEIPAKSRPRGPVDSVWSLRPVRLVTLSCVNLCYWYGAETKYSICTLTGGRPNLRTSRILARNWRV